MACILAREMYVAHLLDPKSISGASVVCPEIRQGVGVTLHM